MYERSLREYQNVVRGQAPLQKAISLTESIDARVVGEIPLGTSRRIGLTTMCLDIRGFSRLSTLLTTADVVRLLNIYFPVTALVVRDHEGIIDKYPGDGLMAHFLLNHEGAKRAVRVATIIMNLVGTTIADQLRASNLPVITCGIGLDAGSDTRLATVGISEHYEIIAVGSSVNSAAKLEKDARPEGVIIGQGLYDMLDWEYRVACSRIPGGSSYGEQRYWFNWDCISI